MSHSNSTFYGDYKYVFLYTDSACQELMALMPFHNIVKLYIITNTSQADDLLD